MTTVLVIFAFVCAMVAGSAVAETDGPRTPDQIKNRALIWLGLAVFFLILALVRLNFGWPS